MTWRAVRWVSVLALGALWWWGVLRLAFAPDAGVLEGAVAAGGWGLSVLPVHCVPKARAEGEVAAARHGGRRQVPSVAAGTSDGGRWWPWGTRTRAGATKAWRRRRWGGGSGPS
ncbi:hypothetical protein ACH4D5_21755 [Streptomyces sp. NPDC018029]|uniref:hypothetical protein n=1 Tax=Streptomyces sp. NPDC018029 TaxID=3365032 RepID=UPI00379465AD